MAEINFGLLDTQLPGRIATIPLQAQEAGQANALRTMQMMQGQQQLQQGATQAEMTRVQLAKIKRDEEALTGLTRAISGQGGPMDLNEAADAMIKTNIPHFVDMGITIKQKQTKLLQDYAAMGLSPPGAASAGPAAPSAMPGAPVPQPNALASASPSAQPNQLDPAAQRARAMMMSDNPGVRDAGKIELERLGRAPVLQNVPGVGLTDPTGRVIKASVEPTDPEIKRYEYAKTQGYKGSLLDFKSAVATAGRAQATPSAPVSVVGPDGKITYVSREEAIRGRMTPAQSETKPLTAQQQLKANETRVTQRGVVTSADTAATELETIADKLLGNPDKKIPPAPGLGGITGYMGLVPSLPRTAARSAQQQLDTFKGKVMAFGRLLATQQGKLGNMAVSEWKFIADAVEKIDPLADNFNDQLRDVVRQAKDFASAKRETFDELYDSTTPTGGANAPQAPADLQSAVQAEIARRANAKR